MVIFERALEEVTSRDECVGLGQGAHQAYEAAICTMEVVGQVRSNRL